MFINDLIYHDEFNNGTSIYQKSLCSIDQNKKVFLQDRNIFLSCKNKNIYKKYNEYFTTKFNIHLHTSSNRYNSYYWMPSSSDNNDISDIHFYGNYSENLICLTPWMIVHRASHSFQCYIESKNFTNEKYYEVFHLYNSKIDELIHCFNKNIFLNYSTEIEDFFNRKPNSFHILPNNIKPLNKLLLKGKAARNESNIFAGDVLGEMMAAHHFGKGQFSFLDQNNIDPSLLSCKKEYYIKLILEINSIITDLINVIYDTSKDIEHHL